MTPEADNGGERPNRAFNSRTRCLFCGSTDTDVPYSRSSKIFVLSTVLPALRRRYCRACGRHFWSVRRRR